MCRGATTTIYPTTSAEDAAYILADAGCRFAIVEDAEQLGKITSRAGNLEKIISIDAVAGTMSLAEVLDLGREHLAEVPDAVTVATDAIGHSDLATLIYTSGTTGRPKGVRLTHHCWVYEGEALKALGFLRTDDVNFLWLPMSHSFGKVILSAQLAVGFTTAIDGRVDKIIENLAVIKPTFMGAAPRIFEKAYGKILSTQAAEGGLKEKIFRSAFAVGAECERRTAAGSASALAWRCGTASLTSSSSPRCANASEGACGSSFPVPRR
ncbi:AMP-binding protein [Arthrobacter alpinus]|nr:AMP-binding protein [Arthrobacter alpinus]